MVQCVFRLFLCVLSIACSYFFPLQAIENKLREMGHNITLMDSFGSVVQGIVATGKESIMANSDYRKAGAPDGY